MSSLATQGKSSVTLGLVRIKRRTQMDSTGDRTRCWHWINDQKCHFLGFCVSCLYIFWRHIFKNLGVKYHVYNLLLTIPEILWSKYGPFLFFPGKPLTKTILFTCIQIKETSFIVMVFKNHLCVKNSEFIFSSQTSLRNSRWNTLLPYGSLKDNMS